MKKYFLLFFTSVVITIVYFSFLVQQTAFAAGNQGDVCSGSGHGTCSGDLFCTPPDFNNPAIESTCLKTQGKSPVCMSHCTLGSTGQECTKNSNCASGLICKPPPNSQALDALCIKTHGTSPLCKSHCDSAPPVQKGGKCDNVTFFCATGLTCTNGKCVTPPGTNSCNADGQHCSEMGGPVCPAGYVCGGFPANCLHLGICNGTCSPVPGGVCDKSKNKDQGPTQPPPPPLPPCQQWNGQGQCLSFGSTFGGFSTDPVGFIEKIFALLLSISGGIALLLIIKAGYQMMTAQGKPEQLQNARDQLVAAIVGLLFLIFSFVFLQLIGFDILHIPGFGK